MREVFTVHIFYPDGHRPESGERRISNLSPKWMGICSELLTHYGPVMKHNMGSTLAHFDIAMAGPVVELLAFDQMCFRLAISLGSSSEQDRATVLQFREIWTRLVESAGNTVEPAAMRILDQAATEQSVLVLDTCQPAVDDDQKVALAQLGEHPLARTSSTVRRQSDGRNTGELRRLTRRCSGRARRSLRSSCARR